MSFTLPNGFSELHCISLAEILNIPRPPEGMGYYVADNMGSTRTADNANPTAVIWTDIYQILNSMSADGLTKLKAYIVRWDAISINPAKIEQGQIGDLTNVSKSYEEERQLIATRVHNLIPVFKRWEYLQLQQSNGGQSISREIVH